MCMIEFGITCVRSSTCVSLMRVLVRVELVSEKFKLTELCPERISLIDTINRRVCVCSRAQHIIERN